MTKTILRMASLAGIAVALLCVTCKDYSGNSPGEDHDANSFVKKFYNAGKGGPCDKNPTPNCANYCDKYPTAEECRSGPTAYSVAFDKNNATAGNAPAMQTVLADSSITLPGQGSLTREGYTFDGWSANRDGSGAKYAAGARYTPTGNSANITLFAKWNAIPTPNPTEYTITFDANGGSGTVPPSQKVKPGDNTTLPSGDGLKMDGYTFEGWSTSSSDTEGLRAGSTYTPSGNVGIITFYAVWTKVIIAVDPTPTITTFVDARDRKTYKKVRIGSQVWMAENLNYDDPDRNSDVCYDNDPENCAKYGRLYNWLTAMDGANSSDAVPSGVRGICPAGWHLPSDDEWTVLVDAVGGWETAGTKLKSSTGWNYGNGTDEYGFSALPGGYGNSVGGFNYVGNNGYWWSATQNDASYAWNRRMSSNDKYESRGKYEKTLLSSVRCVQDQ